ncbi:MAG: MarR family winged helix-turn-helix transcriptional regulator [Candidatus Tectimicrobiota bacterium]
MTTGKSHTTPQEGVVADTAERTVVALMRTGDVLFKACDAFFRPYGLTEAQYNILRILDGAGEPLAQRTLAQRLLVSRPNITSLIDKLEARGFVARTPCADRRVHMIALTEAGRAFVHETSMALQRLCASLMSPLSAAEQQYLCQCLGSLMSRYE